MSKFVLGIFDNLGGYLTAALTECGDSDVSTCTDGGKTYNRYYLQKYYEPKPTNSRDTDVVANFTNAVIDLASKLREVDLSTSSSPTLKSLLLDTVNKFFETVNVKLNMSGTGYEGDVDGSYSGNSKLVSGLKLNSSNAKALIAAMVEAVKQIRDTGDMKNAISNVNSLTLSPANFELSSRPGDVATVKALLKSQVTNDVEKLLATNYTTSPKTGKDDTVANVLRHLKNNDLDTHEEEIFNTFLNVLKRQGDNWVECKPSEINLDDLSNYRINVKMVNVPVQADGEKKVPLLVKYLPELTAGSRLRYNNGSLLSDSQPLILRQIFYEMYSSGKSYIPDYDPNSPKMLVPDLELLIRDVLARSSVPEAHISEGDAEQIDSALRGVWRRIGEDTWEHKLSDGSTVVIKPDTPEYTVETAKIARNCAAVGFSNDPAKCADFLKNVALNDNQKLAEIASEMNEDVAKEAVSQLHPKFAEAILKAFGFHRKVCRDKVAGRQIEKMQRVNEWLDKFVSKKFNEATVNKIKSNQRLLNFLDLLAQLINGNPSVLNEGLIVQTEESVGTTPVPDDLAVRKIGPVKVKSSGKPVLSWSDIQSNMNKVYGSFSRGLTFDGLNTNSPFGLDNLFPQMSLLTAAPVVRSSTWGSLVGGSHDEPKVFLQNHSTGIEYSRNIHNILSELTESLKSSNKTLSKKDKEEISNKMAKFEELENELFRTAVSIQKYAQLLKVVEVENRAEVVTYAHIEKFVEKYNHLLSKYEKTGNSFNTLISLLKDCGENTCCGEDNENCKVVGH